MIRSALLVASLLAGSAAWQDPPSEHDTTGYLIAVGGGGTPTAVFERALELAGSNRAVVVIPHASSLEGRGTDTVEAWREAGARRVTNLDDKIDLAGKRARTLIEEAGILWFSGGSQNRLFAALQQAGLTDLIAERYLAGAIVGGTSAGAAILSEVMIAGRPEPAPFHAAAMHPNQGLGLWTWAIIDQHFLERDRTSRLMTAVLDHKRLLGVGISEKTAVILDGDSFEVLGDGHVLVIDARRAKIEAVKDGEPRGARGIVVDVLHAGQVYERER